nr:MAG TPA: hypothetical protein [Bacteriophage sp.]DAJ84423.1 MAG TPA: hypothetical protein [Bacteriophage sp.]
MMIILFSYNKRIINTSLYISYSIFLRNTI